MAKRSALGKGLGAFFGDDVVKTAAAAPQKENRNIEQENHNHANNVNNNYVSDNPINYNENGSSGNNQSEDSFINTAMKKEENVSRETLIRLTEIEPSEEQPRKSFDEETLQELADSMKDYGVLQPLLVKKKGDNYQIIAGERRWRAAKLAGLKEVPVIIREYNRQQSVEIALIENVQRADLNPIEEALAYQQLMQEFGLKQEEIANRVSKNRATITNSIRLLKLAEPVQKLLISGEISSGHARALLGLEDQEQQIALANDIVQKGLNVRQVEKLVKLMTKPQREKEEKEEEKDLSFIFRDLEERMKGIMGTKVMIHQKDKNKGRIEIEYYSPSELERIVELIETIK